jgi:excisionase family DNA binding protein
MGGERPLTVTVDEAARLLGIGRSLAWRYVREGRWPVLKIGDRTLLSRSFIERLVAELEAECATAAMRVLDDRAGA